MDYGLYLAAGGALTNMHRMDVVANNLANLNTVGFKPDTVVTRHRLPERLENPAILSDPQWMLERLGGGRFVAPTQAQLTQGSLQPTSNDLDLALQGDGFFVVANGAPGGDDQLRLTRDGRLMLSETGALIMATTGLNVLDVNNQPVALDRSAADTTVDARGVIRQDGVEVARLQLIQPDAEQLVKHGQNLFRLADGAALDRTPADGRVMQRHLEQSAVDPIMTLNQLIASSKMIAANSLMMQYHDNATGQTINTFGRVA